MRPFPIMFRGCHAAVAGLLAVSSQAVTAQDVATRVGLRDPFSLDPVFSFGAVNPSRLPAIKGGLLASVGATATYNSNLFLEESGGESEMVTTVAPAISYVTDPEGGAPFSFTGTYTPAYTAYVRNSDLSRFNQGATATFVATGARSTVTVVGGYQQSSGTDRLSGNFVNSSLTNAAIQGGYQLAPRTVVSGGASFSSTGYSGGKNEGARVYGGNLGAFWAATERLSFGPGIGYTLSESDLTGARDSASLSAQADYKIADRLHLAGSLGLQRVVNSRETGGASYGLTGGFNVSYIINELWSWSGSVQYVNVPSPSELNYVVDNLAFSTALSRQLGSGTVSGGVNHIISDYSSVGPVVSALAKEENTALFLNYQRPFLNDRLGVSAGVTYTLNNGSSDWEQVLVTLGAQLSF